MNSHRLQGVTLIELMIVIVITAILAAIAVPAFQDAIDRNRLKAVTEVIYGDFQFAKFEAIKRNSPLVVDFTTSNGGATWCYGMKSNATTCDCTLTNAAASNACVIDNVLKVVRSTDYSGVSMTSTADPVFDNVRGTVSPTSTVTLTSPKNKETRVAASTLGKITICSPTGISNIPGYPTPCP